MTVAELILKLSTIDPQTPVVLHNKLAKGVSSYTTLQYALTYHAREEDKLHFSIGVGEKIFVLVS